MKVAFVEWQPKSLANRQLLVETIRIINEYAGLGYTLTLRQLYYQLVSRDIIPNNQGEYKRLGKLVKNGREGGFIDWDAIVDRGRVLVRPPEWSGPKAILDACARQFRLDRWAGQERYVEVWCEKDALSSVLEPVCDRWHTRFMAKRGQEPVVIYLGDHDPSGLDMTRDIQDRLRLFGYEIPIEVNRLALNFDQIEQYQPPPNPAKFSDSRAVGYISAYGMSCWELDALDPQTLDGLVETEIRQYLDEDLYAQRVEAEEGAKALIREFAESLTE